MAYFGRIFSFGGSRGVWWCGIGKGRLFLKAGWYEPLFSERFSERYGLYGFRIPLGFGWRVIGKRVKS